jgi:hypothetical protein
MNQVLSNIFQPLSSYYTLLFSVTISGGRNVMTVNNTELSILWVQLALTRGEDGKYEAAMKMEKGED